MRKYIGAQKEIKENRYIQALFAYAQTTDNNGYFRIPLAIVGKDGENNIICIGTGEEWGDKFILSVDEISVESIFNLHSLISEILEIV